MLGIRQFAMDGNQAGKIPSVVRQECPLTFATKMATEECLLVIKDWVTTP